MRALLRALARATGGATAIEYGLIAALVAVAGITAFQSLGSALSATFDNVANKVGNASAPPPFAPA